jgi:hypothetical protein
VVGDLQQEVTGQGQGRLEACWRLEAAGGAPPRGEGAAPQQSCRRPAQLPCPALPLAPPPPPCTHTRPPRRPAGSAWPGSA